MKFILNLMPYLQVAYLEQHSCGKEEPMPDHEINDLGSLMVMVQGQNHAPGSFCHPVALLGPIEKVASPGQLEENGSGGYQLHHPHPPRTLNGYLKTEH